MHIRKTFVMGGLLAAAAGFPPLASAQDAGFYVGAGVGGAKDKDSCHDLSGAGFSGKCDDKHTAWKLYGGYEFNKNFGAELGYVDLGRTKASGNAFGLPVSAKADVNGFELVGVGTLPLSDQFSLFAKAGLFRADVDVKSTVAGASAKESDHSTDLTIGAGLKFNITKNVAARLEFQHYNNVGSKSTGQSDINLWMIGASYRF